MSQDTEETTEFSPAQREAACIAIYDATRANAWRSDDVEPDANGDFEQVLIDFTTCEQCAGMSRELLDYALKNDIVGSVLMVVADRPVDIHPTKKGCIRF